MKANLRTMVTVALLIAVEVVLSRFCSIATPIVKIGFGFAPIAVCGMLFGPLWAALAGGLADIVGATLFPIGAYFPGFTISAALTGAVFGLALHRSSCRWMHLAIAVAANILLITMLLTTFWLTIITDLSFLALLPARALQAAIMAPIQMAVLSVLKKPVSLFIASMPAFHR
ncbi:MAG: folate family ECF transporter S component [Clostridiales bacterium]|jgi:ECF transporter S component (folate family)|nr:folate family ECF transporter S component [Clostridiales bacterium]MDR2749243.1 folate family ECF transporter S component [Clostridiales bacterium]